MIDCYVGPGTIRKYTITIQGLFGKARHLQVEFESMEREGELPLKFGTSHNSSLFS